MDKPEDVATISGLIDTGGCCNVENLACHKEISKQHPHFVDALVCLDEESYESVSIGGIKDGAVITHVNQCFTPFVNKGEQCSITLGLTEDLPIDTLFGLGFQQDTKMMINFGTRRVESAFLRRHFAITFKEPRQTNPDNVRLQSNNAPKSLLTTNNK
jgi:hypothetical protein